MSRQLKTQLKKIKDEDIDPSKSSPPTNGDFEVKVVTVYDGDTCHLVLIRNGSLERFRCRLADINAPELKEGRKALKSRDFLAWLCVGNDPGEFSRRSKPLDEDELQNLLDDNKTVIFAQITGIDRYRRPLVILMEKRGAPKSFNEMLLDSGYAEKYKKA